MIEVFENGKLAKREARHHRPGTGRYLGLFRPHTGKITRRERDSTNDGRVDQWWTYDNDKVTIAMDKNGDRKPDPSDTVTIGGATRPAKLAAAIADAGPPPPRAYVPAGMDAEAISRRHLRRRTSCRERGR